MDLVTLINKYGFPIVAAIGGGYFVYYDLIRLNQKLNIVLMMREIKDEKNNKNSNTDDTDK